MFVRLAIFSLERCLRRRREGRYCARLQRASRRVRAHFSFTTFGARMILGAGLLAVVAYGAIR